ncbi:MAG: nucleoside deaminase [Muribaculaceae bacterium]|nr:nucleoside deaminase [Muribaculaceae bacterium]
MIGETSAQQDERLMREALAEAQQAGEAGEVPVGAVIALNGRVIARGHNLTETLCDVTAHAEILAITAASSHLGGKYLPQCTLYVTVEPCAMCAGALGWSQIGRIVYGTADPRRGFRRLCAPGETPLHPRTVVSEGVLADECRSLMQSFFKRRR